MLGAARPQVIPGGTVTFLFTDIEGSTRMWEQYPRAMQAAIARHDALLREAIEQHGGYVFKTVGDAFCAAFPTAPQALDAALKRGADDQPWSLCRRPWSLMYFTAHGRAIPCCIAPFSTRGYDGFTLGDATQQSLRQIWNGPRYQEFRRALISDAPPPACASCGVRWSL